MISGMAYAVTIDKKGRLVLPKESRQKAGINQNSRLIVEVKGPGIIQLRDYDVLLHDVHKVAAKKLTGWKEEEHKEEKLLAKLSKGSLLK
jgi:AbrB family looped-hinge helix DNA binding protein